MKKGKPIVATLVPEPNTLVADENTVATAALVETTPDFVTVGEAAELAAQVGRQLTARAELIKRLQFPHPATRSRTRGARTVPREFVEAMLEIVEWSEMLERVGPLKAAREHERKETIEALRPIHRQALLFADVVGYTIESLHAEAAKEALLSYRIAGSLTTRGADPELAARLEVPKKILGRKGGKRKK